MNSRPAGVTVLGNFAVDHIDDEPPSPGGCPTFAAVAFQAVGGNGRVVTRLAAEDEHIFAGTIERIGVPVTVLPAERTSAFGLRYFGERRVMTVDAIGQPWMPADLQSAEIDTEWIHVAPLLRSDFPAGTLEYLVDRGHCLAYDGQGLVRAAQLGPLTENGAYDPSILSTLTVLKLAEEEAEVVAGGPFDAGTAERLRVPEILVTFGSAGCDLYVEGRVEHVPAAWAVTDVQTTGAGDVFMVAYVSARSEGAPARASAERASAVVARMLEDRRADLRRLSQLPRGRRSAVSGDPAGGAGLPADADRT
jgi:sugar/nucleoside kinase (ribokinase family)